MSTMSTKMLLCFVFLYIGYIDTYITAYTYIYYIKSLLTLTLLTHEGVVFSEWTF